MVSPRQVFLLVCLSSLGCTLDPDGVSGQLSGSGPNLSGGGDADDESGEDGGETGLDVEPSDDDGGGSSGAGPGLDSGPAEDGGFEDDGGLEDDGGVDDGAGSDGPGDGPGDDGMDGAMDDGGPAADCPSEDLDDLLPSMLQGSTLGQVDLHEGSCGGSGPDLGVAFVAPEDGIYTFTTNGSDFDTVLYVLDGAVCGGAELACDDDSGDSTQSTLSVSLSAGQEVVLMVDGYQIAADGAFTLAASLQQDACDNVEVVPEGVPTAYLGVTAGTSTVEGSCGGDSAPEAVLEWTAPEDGTYRITTNGSDYDTVLYVRDGSCAGAELGCDDDGGDSLQSQIVLDLDADQTITIVVDGYSSNEGVYLLDIDFA